MRDSFTDRMLFLSANQQHRIAEGKKGHIVIVWCATGDRRRGRHSASTWLGSVTSTSSARSSECYRQMHRSVLRRRRKSSMWRYQYGDQYQSLAYSPRSAQPHQAPRYSVSFHTAGGGSTYTRNQGRPMLQGLKPAPTLSSIRCFRYDTES